MATRRKSMRLYDHDRRLLIELYLRWRIPIDQFEKRPGDRCAFVDEWNRLSNPNDVPGDVIHYMKTQRKRGLWVKFDGDHEFAPPAPELSAEETEILVSIFYENVTLLENGSDVLSCDDELADLIAKEFSVNAGRIVPAYQLVAKLTALRKRGLLPKVGKPKSKRDDATDIGFKDIDKVPDIGKDSRKLNDKDDAL